MTEKEFLAAFPWIDPTLGYPDDTLREGVTAVEGRVHVAVRVGGAHKSLAFMQAYASRDLDRVDDVDWRLFSVSKTGTVDGRDYVWGMFVEGLGAFDVMVPKEFTRNLLPHEREAWSKKVMGMVGSHSGKLSYTLPSGVQPEPPKPEPERKRKRISRADRARLGYARMGTNLGRY